MQKVTKWYINVKNCLKNKGIVCIIMFTILKLFLFLFRYSVIVKFLQNEKR